MNLTAATVRLADATIALAIFTLTGIVIAAVLGIRQQGTDKHRLAATENLLDLMRAQDHARRTPRLSAEITFDQRPKLHVWLDSGEELASLRLILTEAGDYDCQVGFRVGPESVPGFGSMDEKLVRPGWWDTGQGCWDASTGGVRPYADAGRRSPGQAVVVGLGNRSNASQSSTSRAIRLTVRCRADDGAQWEVSVPVSVTPEAADMIRRMNEEG